MQNTLIETTLQQAIENVRRNIPRFGDQYPHNGDGMAYVLTDNTHWMTSFWPGQLWLAYHVTGDETFRREAERRLASFEHRLVNRIDESHDLGFLYTLSARAQWQMTGDPAARQLGIDAAERLITRFHPKGEYIQAWGMMNDPIEGGRMIVDCLMNLPLLFWASYETGDPKYAEVASKHARHHPALSGARWRPHLSHLFLQSGNRRTDWRQNRAGLRRQLALVTRASLGDLRLRAGGGLDRRLRSAGNRLPPR